MNDDYPTVHNTEINRIQNGDEAGWEFICHSCGYRARYTIDIYGTQKLEILYVGDSTARHTTGQSEQTARSDGLDLHYDELLDDAGLDMDDTYLDDIWLPEDLREQVEAIMKKFD
jgi:hypothetical protein